MRCFSPSLCMGKGLGDGVNLTNNDIAAFSNGLPVLTRPGPLRGVAFVKWSQGVR
jgi:hypothetical protein